MFFEVFQPRVKNLLDAKHLATEDVFGILNPPVKLVEPKIHAAAEIAEPGIYVAVEVIQTLIVYENTD